MGKTPAVINSSDDDEPLSASIRRPTTFKETGLLQLQKNKSGAVTVSPFQPRRSFLTVFFQKSTVTVPNKMAKRAMGTDVSSSKVAVSTGYNGSAVD